MTSRRALAILWVLCALVLTTSCTGRDRGAEDVTAVPSGSQAETGTAPGVTDPGVTELARLDPVGLIADLEYTPVADRRAELIASVRPTELVLADGQGEEVAVPLPEGLFYLSVAPYLTQSHDCVHHSLTTCLGELGDTTVDVEIVDVDTRTVLVSETTRTADNGFVGFWLPADSALEVTMSSGGRTGVVQVGTGEQDPTCVTTLQLR